MQYFKLILSTVLIIIFNQINFVNCKLTFFSGGTGFKSLFTGDKLYFQNFITNFFYVDLTGVSLDSDTLVDQSKWIDLTDVKPQPDSLTSNNPILGGINNDKIMFFDISGENAIIDTFDTTLKQWVINQQVKTPINFFSDNNDWITDAKTGKAYSFDSTTTGMSIFDTVNLSLVKSLSTPKNLFTGTLVFYSDFVQVELPNGQILFIGGKLGSQSQSMKSLLTYDTIKDVWQMTNTAGTEPQGRTKHTAVSTSDGRVIVYGGVLNTVPALPQLAVLDTSIIPYTWSAPTEVNPIGSFSDHTAVMANNYMIFAFGKYTIHTIYFFI
ncbi:hypothetical protein C1645_214939 [Glomus cerebriforme]|uniref:Galactose oxidase n=1 Tax=Glomus cerebriforme TaxID=658196 RepID=A0A397S2V3_9GLOM|nr:hypothetical protein C1645_214939 [Glomus cerebriforme]